ncbi:MAG: acyltransferase [Acidobacteria bacterium]|nr:acyltransferase [Acidobacteriota bacterium]
MNPESGPEPRPATSPRLAGLDALRGLLAVAVAAYHLSVWGGLFPGGTWANMALARLGNYGVSAFFVLSGFILARLSPWERLRREGLGAWWRKRFLRLAPLFYVAVGLNLAFGLGMGPDFSWRFLAENLSLSFGLFHPNHAFVTGGWYVGLVALAYAAWPLAAWLDRGRGWPLLLLCALLGAWSLGPTLHGVMALPHWERFHAYVLPGNQLFLVALGAAGGWLHGRIGARLPGPVVLLLGLACLGWLVRRVPTFYDHFEVLTGWARYTYVSAGAGLVFLAAATRSPLGVTGRVLGRLGSWSFGIYLLHPFAYRLVSPWAKGWTAFLGALLLSLAAGAAAERWIERPLGRLGRGQPDRTGAGGGPQA